ncbi:Brix domain-containing protein [Podospora appendiculata]|uniref:Brix domain-containing protein n=1 Tax=Podospora appendiculata TaxID=314037 RepID=A0AAE0X7Q7_9PEZI|nr:Brix domain-containing protein [Podospora appendiculata]KAK3687582.1 Brix domain-containing protein [Podospora appendiculata]
MARRRTKRRTHAGVNNPATPASINGHADAKDPKSMVIRIGAGEVGTSISQLVTDVRCVMEPGTAARLKERKANRLRDYLSMCGPLGVTHLMLFSRSETGNTNMRLAITPRGPTFHFRVEKYSLSKDVRRAQKHPRGGGNEYITPPLLVMNNFTTPGSDASSKVPRHLESLTTTAFQSLFPPINPQVTPLKSIQRVLLLNREPCPEDEGSFVINFRHYAITTKVVGLSKPLKRLNAAEKMLNAKKGKKGGLPNLGKMQDISEFMIGGENGEGYMTDGGTSGSEADSDAEVEVLDSAPRKVLTMKARAAAAAAAEEGEEGTSKNDNVERRAVKMVELGPRMRLRMTKVEEGLCAGKVMWHEYVHKSKAEMKEMERKWEQRRKEKEARKKIQKENVEKKRKAKAADKKAENAKAKNDDDVDMDDYSDMYEDGEGFDSEGLAGDAEEQVNSKLEEDGEWSEEEEEIANDSKSAKRAKKAVKA